MRSIIVKNATNEDYILWNNYYDYQFTNADKVDFFIVSTDRQREVLQEQFAKYTQHRPKIVTIPVGSIDALTESSQGRKPFSLITASRLAKEKHIDWLVKAVIEARKEIPELTFDIYGSGGGGFSAQRNYCISSGCGLHQAQGTCGTFADL